MSNPNPNPLRRLPGWALLLIAVGLVLFIAVATVATWAWSSHRAGQLEWQETVAELESKGFACSPQSYLKMNQIEVDEDLLGQYRAWQTMALHSWSLKNDLTWLGGGHEAASDNEHWWGASPPEQSSKRFMDGSLLWDDLVALLRTEKLQTSEIPYLLQEFATAKSQEMTLSRPKQTSTEHYLVIAASTMLCYRVLVNEALPALRDLDLLYSSLNRSCTSWENYVGMKVSEARDGSWLGALVHRRINPTAALPWLEESDSWVGRMTSMARCNMVFFSCHEMQDMELSSCYHQRNKWSGTIRDLEMRIFFYLYGHHLAARHARETYRVVTAIESGRWTVYDRKLPYEFGPWQVQLQPDFSGAWHQELHARLVRTAVRIVIAHDQIGQLPADEPAIIADGVLIPTMPMTTGRIRYERLSDHRFRVCADPAGPFPDPDLRRFIVSRNDFGKGASSNLLVDKRGSIEIDIAGLREAKR